MYNPVVALDLAVESYINSLISPGLETLFGIITHLGGFFVISLVSLGILWFFWHRRIPINYFVWALVANEALVYLLKNLIGRLRPLGALRYGEFDPSMPSGHAAIAMFVYGFVCYLVYKFGARGLGKALAIATLLAVILLVGASRLYMDVHYLSDVLAGYFLGGTTLFYLIKISEKRRTK